jgi:hypothetical protein
MLHRPVQIIGTGRVTIFNEKEYVTHFRRKGENEERIWGGGTFTR